MIELALDARILGNATFGASPLGELGSSLRVLTSPRSNSVHGPWVRAVVPRVRDLDVTWLGMISGDDIWVPDFLFPPVEGPRVTLDDQLHQLSRLSADDLVAELRAAPRSSSLTRQWQELLNLGPGVGKHMAAALERYWATAVAPYWVRVCNTLEEDMGYRASEAMRHGMYGLFNDLGKRVRVVDNRLVLDLPGNPDQVYRDAGLTLVPSVFLWPGLVVTHGAQGRFQITYGARGTARVWEGLASHNHDGRTLAALIGRARASILEALHTPQSTTQLAHQLGQSPGAVSQHLRVLRESGLATSWRTGRVVLYRQTPLATSLIEMNRVNPTEN